MTGSILGGSEVRILKNLFSREAGTNPWKTGCPLWEVICKIFRQVRKLEFLLGDAIHRNCDTIVTMGTTLSNHCRSTSIAANQLGLKCHLFIYGEDWNNGNCHGNALLTKLMASDVTLTEYCGIGNMYRKMEEFSKDLR